MLAAKNVNYAVSASPLRCSPRGGVHRTDWGVRPVAGTGASKGNSVAEPRPALRRWPKPRTPHLAPIEPPYKICSLVTFHKIVSLWDTCFAARARQMSENVVSRLVNMHRRSLWTDGKEAILAEISHITCQFCDP
eukprot:6178384-Pleurochrysis_carterae.AAC.1